MQRIEKENHAFAKRLFDKQAVLRKDHLDQFFHDHLKFKRQIAKVPRQSKSRGAYYPSQRSQLGTAEKLKESTQQETTSGQQWAELKV